MESYGKKFLFKAIVETLYNFKLKNKVFIGAKKIRNVIEKKLDYAVSTNLLSKFISISLDWLVASGYLKLIKKNSPKRYLIPENFEIISKNIDLYY
ncbi:MAG: hypothetical protein ACTSRG_17900 [Candidatus Helarchaeota archaeon]